MAPQQTPYDQIPYHSAPFPQTRPEPPAAAATRRRPGSGCRAREGGVAPGEECLRPLPEEVLADVR